jgi:iron complex outermembrane receptor protein
MAPFSLREIICRAGTGVLGIGAALAPAAMPWAQESDQVVIEEIVVTAQKREQSLKEVPITISAFSGEFLERAKIEDIKSLIDVTPGVMGNTKDSFIDYVAVRGILTNDFGVGGDPSVGIYKDGVYQSRNGFAVTSFYDIERVEVLKGPQGLLFGRNAASGAFSIITAKPSTDELGGYVKAGVGERSHYEIQGAVNVPLNDRWALRVAGFHLQEDGYTDNAFGGDDLVEVDHKTAGRIMLGYEGDRLSGWLMAEHEDRKLSATIYRALLLDETGLDEEDVNTDLADRNFDKGDISSFTLELNYDFDFARLTSISAYRDHNYKYLEDFDGSPLLINNYLQDQDGDYWSQELRLVSSGAGPLQWFAGASIYSETIDADFSQQADEDVMCEYYLGGPCAATYEDEYGEPWPGPQPEGLVESNRAKGDYEGWAVYGNIAYDITERLTAEVGLRYTYDEKDFDLNVFEPTSALGAFFNFGFWTDGKISDDQDWDEWTPRFALLYDASDDITLFATAVRGYKSGGFGTFTANIPEESGFIPFESDPPAPPGTSPDPFGPETLWSYEAGVKTRLLSDRLQWNGSVFYYDYDDLQIIISERIDIVENVGKAKGYGFETDVRYLPNQYLDLYAGLAYLDTEIDDAESICDTCNDNELPLAPEWTFNAIATFRYPLFRFADAFVTGEYLYSDDFFSELENLDEIKVDSYDVTNFRFGLEDRAGVWEAAAYVENAFDEFYWDAGNPEDELLPATMFGPARPRTWGVDFTYRF